MKFNATLATLSAVAFSAFSVLTAKADLYNITFAEMDGNLNTYASGQIDVVDGFAVSGFLDVLTGPGYGTYATLDVTFDHVVDVNSQPFLDSAGLVFADSGPPGYITLFPRNGYGNPLEEVGGTNYTPYNFIGYNYGAVSFDGFGSVSLTPVPEKCNTLLLLGLGLGVAVGAKHFLFC